MAAIKSEAIQALTAAALALPGMVNKAQATQPVMQPELDFQYGHYQESDQRISVDIYQGQVAVPLSDQLALQSHWAIDTFSGATPVLTLPESVAETTSGASGINAVQRDELIGGEERPVQVMTGASTRETRYGIDLGIGYSLGNLNILASGSRSDEPDYLSHAYHLGADWAFNQKLTTLSVGLGQNFDQIEPTTRPISEEKTDYYLQLGVSQILDKRSLWRFSGEYRHSAGFLSNPYKKVYIQNLSADSDLQDGGFGDVYFENRPDRRDQGAVSLGYIRYFSAAESALHLDYRFFTDSWNITSHTVEAAYHQPIGKAWMVIPRLRYYSQNRAGFYQAFYTSPREDNHYSSDFRLAGFGTLGGAIKISREWRQANALTETIKLEAGVEYTVHAAALQLGKQSDSAVTDFNYLLFTGAIKILF